MRLLVFLIIVIPALEIGFLLLSGKTIGVLPTILLIVLTGVVGAWLAKKQGIEALRKAQQQMQYGQIPNEAILDGLCILVGGLLLLTPGFITDMTGFLLLFPISRNKIKPILLSIIRKMIDKNQFTIIR
ncbi:FxsA family protein [Metabacillus bambusae]|uniref:Membrane protein FxsA n=1 Tax=Metabacillus bambusae TaxID=2795218 RepID=A0ABS3N7U4_9BACI|nr:FxsA family protein [Metabacillus bambusae]MBO1514243.1 membrane protein FxsA [Metabacillus bambusae]